MKIIILISLHLLVCTLFVFKPLFAGGVYKCTSEKGKITYQGQPCKKGKEAIIKKDPNKNKVKKIVYATGDSDPNAFSDSEKDAIKVGSLVCGSGFSYNETIIVDMKNQIADLKGTKRTSYPKDCIFIKNKPLSVNFIKYSGGSAVVSSEDKTLHTSKTNIILGLNARKKESSRDKCLKKVLEKFCLGGSVSELPKPDLKKAYSYIYEEGDKKIFVNLVNKRIASVSIFYPHPSWLNYRILLDQLKEKYGAGVNLDTFPDYADSDSSKETSIVIKKGRAMTLWSQTGWSIKYGWASNSWRILEYMHDELSEKNRKKSINRL